MPDALSIGPRGNLILPAGTVPTNRHTTILNDSDPISGCFDDDPKLLNCEIAQPSDDFLTEDCRYSMLRNSASGPEIGLPDPISTGSTIV